MIFKKIITVIVAIMKIIQMLTTIIIIVVKVIDEIIKLTQAFGRYIFIIMSERNGSAWNVQVIFQFIPNRWYLKWNSVLS